MRKPSATPTAKGKRAIYSPTSAKGGVTSTTKNTTPKKKKGKKTLNKGKKKEKDPRGVGGDNSV